MSPIMIVQMGLSHDTHNQTMLQQLGHNYIVTWCPSMAAVVVKGELFLKSYHHKTVMLQDLVTIQVLTVITQSLVLSTLYFCHGP